MPPLQRLDEAAGVRRKQQRGAVAPAPATSEAPQIRDETRERGKVLRVYKWYQFHGKEQVTEFDEAHFSLEGLFSQNSSQGHKEYQDKLRAIHLRTEGMQKAAIAKALGRSEKFVAKWWQKEVKEIPRPWGVHEYLTKAMGKNENNVGATNGASMTSESVSDTATWWRDVEVRRRFASDPSIYDDILQGTEWKPSNARTRDFATGAYHLKYDRLGNIRWEGHQGGKYKQGTSAAMDKAMQRLFAEYGIADRTSGVIVNWYPDGQGNLGSHRHDCWTALFSFGQERILTIDNTPLLMQDGDLCIFGTQRHGVPIMPEVTEGRITLVVFFYPNSMQKKGMWQTLTDPETMEASPALARLLSEQHLSAEAEHQQLQQHPKPVQDSGLARSSDGGFGESLRTLQELGFARADAEMALRAGGLDVERAAELLFMSGAVIASDSDNAVSGGRGEGVASSSVEEASTQQCEGRDATVTATPPQRWGGRFRKRTSVEPENPADPIAAAGAAGDDNECCSAGAAARSGTCSTAYTPTSSDCDSSSVAAPTEDTDEALACRIQFEEESAKPSHVMSDAEVAALALQLDEMEAEHGIDSALLAAQFQEYDSKLTLQDAETWNGQGDLMHSPFSREHLSIDTMEKATVFSVGHGDLLEKDFWEVLQCHSIRVLYDVRPTDYRGEHRSRHQRFAVTALRAQCRSRGVAYKHMPIGRESAYGLLSHIESDEGKHTLVELVWQASRKRTAFLGSEEHWQDDGRQVIAEQLTVAGHTVQHVDSSGASARHTAGTRFPEWVLREAERLKLLEKKRQAGEHVAPQKSRTDRSSEAVASALDRRTEEVDAMREMRDAANQKELIVAQRKLARYHRIAEEKGALARKVVANVPHWIAEDARKQAEWAAAKKHEKGKDPASESPSMSGIAATDAGKTNNLVSTVAAVGSPLLGDFETGHSSGSASWSFSHTDPGRRAGDVPAPQYSEEDGTIGKEVFEASSKRCGNRPVPASEDAAEALEDVPAQQEQPEERGHRAHHRWHGPQQKQYPEFRQLLQPDQEGENERREIEHRQEIERHQASRTSWRGRRAAAH